MTYLELFQILSKSWLDVNDIKKIGVCGRDTASKIRDNIISSINKQGYNLPNCKSKIIPTSELVSYFNLDLDYISNMASKEKQLVG